MFIRVHSWFKQKSTTHADARRSKIPTAELEAVVSADGKAPKQVRYPRNTDLDLQLVCRGTNEQDWSDLVVNAPPLYIQEKAHPKVLIDDLLKQTQQKKTKSRSSTCSWTSTESPKEPTRRTFIGTIGTGRTA